MAVATPNDSAEMLARAAVVTGEVLMPGVSDLMAGNLVGGVATLVGTGLAVALLAPTMPLLAVAAGIGLRVNSYNHAISGRSMFSGLSVSVTRETPPATPAASHAEPAAARSR